MMQVMKKIKITMFHSSIFLGVLLFASCAEHKGQTMDIIAEKPRSNAAAHDTATFGTGCFWCTEAIFQRLNGVIKVTSGYGGGEVLNPTYEEVCTGTTGHAECCQI